MNQLATLLFLFSGLFTFLYTPKKSSYVLHTIAFYNLENLFDPYDDPKKLDEHSPIMRLPESQREKIYLKKLTHMVQVLNIIGVDHQLGNSNSPVLIGVCEVENQGVLEDLIHQPELKNKYDFVHVDSPDIRGIDVALLYQPSIFRPTKHSSHSLKLYDEITGKRIFTRDQLLVSGYLDNEYIHLLINHWPSRRGGTLKSNAKRRSAAQLSKKLIDSIQSTNPYTKIIVMGDFNDNPTNESIKNILSAKGQKKEVRRRDFFNPMMSFFKKGEGTLIYRDELHLFDQILFSSSFLGTDYNSYKLYKSGIFNPQFLKASTGRYSGYPLRSFNNTGYNNGYADHFPVYSYLIKKQQKSRSN